MSALKKQYDSKRMPAVALRAERELHHIGAKFCDWRKSAAFRKRKYTSTRPFRLSRALPTTPFIRMLRSKDWWSPFEPRLRGVPHASRQTALTKILCARLSTVVCPWLRISRKIPDFCRCRENRSIAPFGLFSGHGDSDCGRTRARRQKRLPVRGKTWTGCRRNFLQRPEPKLLVNSRGLSAAYRQTIATFSVTMQQGSAASWAKANSGDVRQFDPPALAKIASEKATRAQNPVELAPGKYTVVLEPAAVLDLVGFLFYDFAATAVADNAPASLAALGKTIFGKNITITDDAYHPQQLGAPFDGEGMPRQRVALVDNGVVKNLVYSRRLAKQAGKSHRAWLSAAERIWGSSAQFGGRRREDLAGGDDRLDGAGFAGHAAVVYT